MKIHVSVIIPLRNEEKHISECLESIIRQSYPKQYLEVFLVDGQSEDGTRNIIEMYAEKYSHLKILDNPSKIVPTALNIGVKSSKGDVIIRMDAHTHYDENYIAKCIETLINVDAVNVGGPIVTLPGDNTDIARTIALATSHPFGVGNSKFRTSNKAQYVDTVPFGAFKREIFTKVGLFNEKLIRNQDIEFNARIRKSGGKIFLNPEIKSYYYNRSTLRGLWKQNFRNGLWNVLTLKISGDVLSIRHFIPFLFITSIIASTVLSLISWVGFILLILIIGSYLVTNLYFSFIAGSRTDISVTSWFPIVFCIIHFSYGIGSLYGILRAFRFSS